MLKIDIINYKNKDIIEQYLFALFIINKNIIKSNINIFQNLNIS